MKKTIDYELSAAEKQALQDQKISQKMLRDYASDEIATLLDASPQRAKELAALAEFQSIPSLGVGFAKELMAQGYYSLEQLRGKTAVDLFDAFERHSDCWPIPAWRTLIACWYIISSTATIVNAGGTLRRSEKLTGPSMAFRPTGR